MDSTEHLLPKASYEKISICPACDQQSYVVEYDRTPHRRARYWIVSIVIHATIITLVTLGINISRLTVKHVPLALKAKGEVNHDQHLVGTPEGGYCTVVHTSKLTRVKSAALLS